VDQRALVNLFAVHHKKIAGCGYNIIILMISHNIRERREGVLFRNELVIALCRLDDGWFGVVILRLLRTKTNMFVARLEESVLVFEEHVEECCNQ
jgi:hypothetical protein